MVIVVGVPAFDDGIVQGALRDLSKRNHEQSLVAVEQAWHALIYYLIVIGMVIICTYPLTFFLHLITDKQVDDGNDSDCRTAANPALNNLAAAYSEHDNPALVADRKVFQSQKMLH